jgi:hypothetical protein
MCYVVCGLCLTSWHACGVVFVGYISGLQSDVVEEVW